MIEDKRKFDIMEFVSFGSIKDGEEPVASRRGDGRGGVSFLSSAPAHLVPQVLHLVEAQATYFQQGHEELNRLAQYRKELGAQVKDPRQLGPGG